MRDGVSGLVVCGTVGENTSMTVQEKLAVIEVARDAADGKVPVIAGIAEFTTAFAQNMAREAQKAGVDGIMVMPALVYSAKPHETAAHFRSVACATDLPIMVYNNPPIYKNDVTPDILTSLVDCENIVCFKDSSGDTRRFIDLRNEVGDRFVLFAGLDDVVLESLAVGAQGWISGMSNAFPREGKRCSGWRRKNAMRKPWRCTAGLCHCCTSMPAPIWCSASNSANSGSAAAAPSLVRRACRCRAGRSPDQRRDR